jgi:hypothetical protein
MERNRKAGQNPPRVVAPIKDKEEEEVEEECKQIVVEICQPDNQFLILEMMGQVTFLINLKQLNFLSEFITLLENFTAGQPKNFQMEKKILMITANFIAQCFQQSCI